MTSSLAGRALNWKALQQPNIAGAAGKRLWKHNHHRLTLSPGKTDQQVVASGRKLNLRRNLRWVAKRTRKFLASTRKSQIKTFQSRLSSISLASNGLMDLRWLGLSGQTVKNLRRLASKFDLNLKPWPNGVASRPKFSTCVYLRLRLARPCVDLRWLAMTCAHFGRDQICTQVDASLSPFGHPTQVNASWVTSISLSLANEIEDSLP